MSDDKGKPYNKMSKKELEQLIRSRTRAVNSRIREYRESDYSHRIVEQSISYLKNLSGVDYSRTVRDKKGTEVELGVGKVRGRDISKEELILRARELQGFLNWDVVSPKARRTLEKRERASWESFRRNHQGWNYEEWRKFTDIAGSLGSDVLKKFGSDTVLEDFIVRSPEQQAEFLDVLRTVYKEDAKNKGLTPEQAMDLVKERLNNI